MTETKTIKEVRKVRSEIATAHGHDPKRLVQHYIKMQKKKAQQAHADERANARR